MFTIFNALCTFSAVQAHWSWAYGLDAVLLASGYSKPADYGATGSGIYVGQKGALTYYMTETQGSKLLIADVPKNMSSSKNNSKSVGDFLNKSKICFT